MLGTRPASKLTAGYLLAALILAGALTLFDVVPAASQDALLRAWAVQDTEDLMDPWSDRWDGVRPSVAALSAQNATKPLGGGQVATLKARALQDGKTLYVLLEWNDKSRDSTVNGQTVFADSAAVEFPSVAGVAIPSFCMGDATGAVNIWHWKAVWQEDIDADYTTEADLYPGRFVDDYPHENDAVYQTGRAAGNPLSQLTHVSPVENLVAGGFGTLTTASLQDVAGRGEWKDGRWRVVFARPLTTQAEYPSMAVGDLTNVAFAVWDGKSGNRDGIKSVSQFMNLQLSTAPLKPADGGFPWWGWAIGFAAIVTFGVSAAWAYYGRRPAAS